MILLLLSAALLACPLVASFVRETIPLGSLIAHLSIFPGMASAVPAIVWRRRMAARRVSSLGKARCVEQIPERSGRVYLGRGIEWTPRRAVELARRAIERPGAEALHALGRSEEADLYLMESELEHHLLVLGTTGTGKTRMMELLVTQAIRRGDAVAVVDPKGDAALLARVAAEARRAGRPFALIAPPYPERSEPYNPIAHFLEPREIADRIAALLPAGGEAEPFRNFAWEIVEAHASAMARHGEPMTLANLRRLALEDPWALPRRLVRALEPALSKLDPESMARKFLQRHPDAPPEVTHLMALALRPREHTQKLASALVPILSKLTSGSHRHLLSPEAGGFSWGRFDRDRGVAYFFLGSLLGLDTAQALARMALLDFQSYVGAKYALGGTGGPISIFVDELADVVSPGLIALLNKGRAAGVRVTGAAQTLADLEAALGSRAQARQVVANANTVIQFRSPSLEDAEAFSALAGARLLPNRTEGESYEPALFGSGLRVVDDFRAVFSRSVSWRAEEFVPAWAVTELPRFEFFVRSGGRVAKGIVPVLSPVSEVAAKKGVAP